MNVEVTMNTNIATYLATLDKAIINQNLIDHVKSLQIPVTIIRGTRDLLVVERNIDILVDSNQHITHYSVTKAGHNVVKVMRQAVIAILTDIMSA